MQKGFWSKIKNRMANSVDPEETAHCEPSHLDLYCLHRYLFGSTGLKGLLGEWIPCKGNDSDIEISASLLIWGCS